MLKHELQQLTLTKQKSLALRGQAGPGVIIDAIASLGDAQVQNSQTNLQKTYSVSGGESVKFSSQTEIKL